MKKPNTFKYTWLHIPTVICVFLSFLISSCSSTKPSKMSNTELFDLKKRATKSLQAAERLIDNKLQYVKWKPGEVWLLQQYLNERKNSPIEKNINYLLKTLSGHPYEIIINPDSDPIPLPINPGTGFQKFTNYCVAPFGAPPERAITFIESFLSTKEQGYVLTHQFMVIVWAQERNLNLPKDVIHKQKDLLKQIQKEQASDEHFSDLYAERAMILLRYGKPTTEEVVIWTNKILEAQQENGGWYAYKNLITYDGETLFLGGVQTIDLPHATALCMLNLATFLNNY